MTPKVNRIVRLALDAFMLLMLTQLMAYHASSEAAHEWHGVAMTSLLVVHQWLNRRWYASLFSGRYTVQRAVMTGVFALTLIAYALTAFCGLAMSSHAAPFLYGMAPSSFARPAHLAASYWAFILTGIHVGLHIPAMFGRFKPGRVAKALLHLAATAIAGVGFYLFLKNGILDYIFLQTSYAAVDPNKTLWFSVLENILMLSFWAYAGALLISAIKTTGKCRFLPVLGILAAVAVGWTLHVTVPQSDAPIEEFEIDLGDFQSDDVDELDVTEPQ